MKRLVHVKAFFQHMPPYSGAASLRGASVMCAVARLLEANPDTVQVYTSVPAPAVLPGISVIALPTPEVENALSLRARLWGELRMGWSAAAHMFDHGAPCDLAIISTPGYVAALVIAARARQRSIPYVVELRDVYPQVYAEAGLIKKGGWLYGFLANRSAAMYQGAKLVIAATQGLAREVRSASSSSTVVECVYNGFPSSLLQRTAPKFERFTVCFHGILGFFQDVETLVAVAAALQAHEVDVVVVGYGRKEAQLTSHTPPNLRFLGRLTFDETMKQVEQCHVGLCLRKDEEISKDAFPVKVWEYLGLGLPSIVTPPCEAGHFLEQHGCGFQLPAGDVQHIVEKIIQLRTQKAELQIFSERCRLVAARFTREQTGATAAQLIVRLLNEPPAQAQAA